jgi:D-glycero-alpha-D-manno-heptose-7-phosphate kinase
LNISNETRYTLEDNLLLFFTGYSRGASLILKEQKERSENNDQFMIQNLHYIKDLAKRSQKAFESGNLEEFAKIMNEHWEYKKKRSSVMTNSKIEDWYKFAMENGALGGKLIGAGGGGFLMFYSEDKKRLRQAMKEAGLQEVRFRFDYMGTRVIVHS